jgi:glutamate formiminotransferase
MVVFPVSMELLELVPNVSEGRSKAAVQDIAEAFASGEGVRLLDRHSDASHNRSVLTAVAELDSVLEAAARLVERAIARTIPRHHRGFIHG